MVRAERVKEESDRNSGEARGNGLCSRMAIIPLENFREERCLFHEGIKCEKLNYQWCIRPLDLRVSNILAARKMCT